MIKEEIVARFGVDESRDEAFEVCHAGVHSSPTS
jgi:hypothetical protein